MLQFILNAGPNLVSIVTDSITKNLGWKYPFHIQVACIGFQTVLLLFFCLETTFVRDQRLNLDKATAIAADEDVAVEKLASMAHAVHVEETASKHTDAQDVLAIYRNLHRKIFRREYPPSYRGTICCRRQHCWFVGPRDGRGALSLLRSVELCACPDILPPYNLTPDGIGLLSFGPFIGSTIACAALG